MNGDDKDSGRVAAPGGWGMAWMALCVAFALHVVDEALTNFLSFYNPMVQSLRERLGWFPMPTFTFERWLGGLIVAIAILFALSPFAFRGARWLRPLGYVFAVVMLANGLAHTLGSINFQRLLPGVSSAPLLLAASVYLLHALWQRKGPSQR